MGVNSMAETDVANDHDRAVAAVRKWLAECDRADRLSKRYGVGSRVAKVGEAAERAAKAHREAIVALSCLQFGNIEIDDVVYELRLDAGGETYIEHWQAADVEPYPNA